MLPAYFTTPFLSSGGRSLLSRLQPESINIEPFSLKDKEFNRHAHLLTAAQQASPSRRIRHKAPILYVTYGMTVITIMSDSFTPSSATAPEPARPNPSGYK